MAKYDLSGCPCCDDIPIPVPTCGECDFSGITSVTATITIDGVTFVIPLAFDCVSVVVLQPLEFTECDCSCDPEIPCSCFIQFSLVCVGDVFTLTLQLARSTGAGIVDDLVYTYSYAAGSSYPDFSIVFGPAFHLHFENTNNDGEVGSTQTDICGVSIPPGPVPSPMTGTHVAVVDVVGV